MDNRRKINRFYVVFFGALFLLAFAWLIQLLVQAFSTVPPDVHNNGVFHQNFTDTFRDFININLYIENFSPYIDMDSSYPPFNFVIALPFTRVMLEKSVDDSLALYFSCALAMLCILLLLAKKRFSLNWRATGLIALAVLFSSPTLFLIERANYVVFTFFFTGLFLLTYESESRAVRECSYLWLAMAVATKMYPAVFGLLLLKERRFFDLVRAALYSLLLFFLPFFMMEGGVVENIEAFLNNLTTFSGFTRLSLDVSAGGGIRITAYLLGLDYVSAGVSVFSTIFRFTAFAILCVNILLIGEKWQTVFFCSLASILLPSPVMINTLIMAYFGVFALLIKKEKRKIDYVYLAFSLLLLNPLQLGYIIDFVPRELQYEGIQLDNPNYLGLTVNVYLQSLAVIGLTVLLSVDTAIALAKKYRKNA